MSESLQLPGPLQILADYEELRPMLCFGLYVVPDTIDLYIWHGLIVLRDGRYKVVTFLDKPYHPLVDPASGILQLELQFPKWVVGVDRLPPVVEYVRTVLTSDLVMDPKKSLAYNMEALNSYLSTPKKFETSAQASAYDSTASAVSEVSMESGVVSPPIASSYDDKDDPFAWMKSPLLPSTNLLTSAGLLREEARTVGNIAACIGLRRGFRLTEPTLYHEALLLHIKTTRLEGSEYTDLVVRGIGSQVEPSAIVSPTNSSLQIGPHAVAVPPSTPPRR